jgi:hypothetical protein
MGDWRRSAVRWQQWAIAATAHRLGCRVNGAVLPSDSSLHASMSQSAVWFAGLRGERLNSAITELTDTLMMLVGAVPHPGAPGPGARRA